MKILILNGPNLNLLGKREPEIYGSTTFDQYFKQLQTAFAGEDISYQQSNHEGELVDALHLANGVYDGVVLNAAAYTHTSVALHDAVKSVDMPVVEVHISNIFQREDFRQHSFISPVAVGMITGMGLKGYELAVRYLLDRK